MKVNVCQKWIAYSGMAAGLLFCTVLFAAAAEQTGWSNVAPERRAPASVKVLWHGDFEKDVTVSFCDGAKGKTVLVDSQRHSRQKALRIQKENQQGYILVLSKKPFAARKGQELQSVAEVSCTGANPDYSVGMLRLVGKNGSLAFYDKVKGASNGGEKMTYLINTAPGCSERKLCHLNVDDASGEEITPGIVVAGTPSDSIWENWIVEDYPAALKAWRANIALQAKPDRKKERIPDAELDRILQADTDHSAKVIRKDGLAVLTVDGKRGSPAFFKGYPYSKLADCEYAGKRMEAAGLELQVVTLRFGNSRRMEGLWKGKDDFDVQQAVRIIRDAMRIAPRSKFILTLITDPYETFGSENPDEILINEQGQKVYGNFVHAMYFLEKSCPPQYWYWVSMDSRVWRKGVEKNISLLADELKKNGMSKRIIGVHLAGFHDHQFALRQVDCSKPAQSGFREFLREKYGTDAALRKAWRDDRVSIASAALPEIPKNTWLDPRKQQNVVDFYAYQHEMPQRTQEALARCVKKSFGKDIVVLRWCMSPFGGTWGSVYNLTRFTRNSDIDILVAQPSYSTRLPALACPLRSCFRSYHRHGKLFLNEFDLRTWGGLHHGETEMRTSWAGHALDAPMWRSLHRKLAGQMIAQNMGYWYYDMAPNWFEPPEVAEDIAGAAKELARVELGREDAWLPEAAFVVDEAGMLLRNLAKDKWNFDEEALVGGQLKSIAASGVPYDIVLLQDLLDDPGFAKHYKLLIFAGMNYVDPPRDALIRQLKQKGTTLVFLAGTGSVKGADKVCEMKIKLRKKPADHEMVPAEGIGFNVLSTLQQALLTRFLRTPKVNNFYRPLRFEIQFAPGIRPVACFAEPKAVAIAEKMSGKSRIVYIGEPGGLTPEYLNDLMLRSGGFAAAAPGVQLDMNGKFLSIHALDSGRRTFRLPFDAKVRNIKTGEMVPVTDRSFSFDMEPGATYWFDLIRN